MVRNVTEYCSRCDTCQRGNNRLSKVKAELHPIPVTDVWKHIGIDLIAVADLGFCKGGCTQHAKHTRAKNSKPRPLNFINYVRTICAVSFRHAGHCSHGGI